MSELFKSLSNIRSLRMMAREVSLEQLETLLEKVTIIVEEKREAVKAQELERQKVREGLNKYKEMLAQDGITVEELAALIGGSTDGRRQPRGSRPAKYKFTDEHGNEKTWTGQGRTPRAIQAALDAGKSLEDFAI